MEMDCPDFCGVEFVLDPRDMENLASCPHYFERIERQNGGWILYAATVEELEEIEELLHWQV